MLSNTEFGHDPSNSENVTGTAQEIWSSLQALKSLREDLSVVNAFISFLGIAPLYALDPDSFDGQLVRISVHRKLNQVCHGSRPEYADVSNKVAGIGCGHGEALGQ